MNKTRLRPPNFGESVKCACTKSSIVMSATVQSWSSSSTRECICLNTTTYVETGGGRRAVPLLEARGLTKRFGGVTALDALDLSISAGEVIGVMGPNGAGKSTLLKTLLGEITPDAGEILLDGRSILGWPTHRVARSGIALANQVPRPFLQLTVAQNVRVGALARGDRRQDIDVLDLCGLRDKAHRSAGTLGLLDLKRLELARALSLNPRVLFLDEVGAGLVSHETEQMIEIVRKVRDQGVALVVVEHVEAVIRALSERVVVIDWGKVVARGTPEEVAADPVVRSIYLGEGTTPTPPASGSGG